MERKPSGIHEMFAQTAVQAAETDPVLKELDAVLDTDALYQQVCAKLDRLGGETTAGEVLVRVLLVKSLYDWSAQQTVEQMADSLVLCWCCRLGMQPAPTESLVSQGAGQVPVATLEELVNRVEQARERAKSSEGRLRPTYRERWR
jgi:hypothetical protein